jgi:hypothetical protein
MSAAGASNSDHSRRISPIIPWLVLVSASVPYAFSLFIAAVEFGDPPYTANDWLQHLLLAAWIAMFLSAIVIARATNDPPTFHGIISFSFVLTVLGLFFVL